MPFEYDGGEHTLGHGDVVLAAITSCTNTSNPSVMIGAALLARNALAKGLDVKPFVKTSLAPGSGVVTQYDDDARAPSVCVCVCGRLFCLCWR